MLTIISKKLVNFDRSSVQFNMPKILSESILSWGKKNIPDSDLYTKENEYGRENEIHVTVKYGLHTANVNKIEKVVNEFGSFFIKLGNISRFVPPDEDYDVVKIEVDSNELHELHRLLGDLPNSDDHPVYQAHCTIAYVKKGYCANLSGNIDLKGQTAKVSKLIFSSYTGKKSEVSL